MPLQSALILFLAAELTFILVNSRGIYVALKSAKRRTKSEQDTIDHGLVSGLVVEAVLFVPLSALLLLSIAPLIVPSSLAEKGLSLSAIYGVLGIVSYGFPFAAIKQFVTRVAVKTLREFMDAGLVECQTPQSAEGDQS